MVTKENYLVTKENLISLLVKTLINHGSDSKSMVSHQQNLKTFEIQWKHKVTKEKPNGNQRKLNGN